MADRFPSLEDFDGDVQTDTQTITLAADASADDFLARERAALGEDANLFATPADDNQLGGDSGDAETLQFQRNFPDLTAQNQPSTTAGPSITYNSGYAAAPEVPEEEPEVIKVWREKRDEQIAKRVTQFAQQRQETVSEAQRNIDDFYESYNNKKDKSISQTRKEAEQFLNGRDDVTSGGTSWERIAKLVDLSGKGSKGGAAGSGKERFRELLVSLRKDEKAPGTEGY